MPPIKRSMVIAGLKGAIRPTLLPEVDNTGHLVIGYGRDLDVIGIDRPEADHLLENDVTRTIAEAMQAWAWLPKIEDEPRAAAIVELAVYRGVAALCLDTAFIGACAKGQYNDAAEALERSVWRSEREAVALRLAYQIRTGKLVARAA